MFGAEAMHYRQVKILPSRFRTELRGISVDQQGRIYASGDSEIKVFDAAGTVARRWSTANPPLSVALAPDGSVYAGEEGQIEIFDAAGKLIHTWRDDKL